LFIAAKSKRQVIMVTHNANLVINTDPDQVIVAETGTTNRETFLRSHTDLVAWRTLKLENRYATY